MIERKLSNISSLYAIELFVSISVSSGITSRAELRKTA